MKKQLLITVMLMMTVIAMAVPAKRGVWKTLVLADGTEVRAHLVGDEHGHYWLAEDGKAYNEAEDAEYYVQVDAQQVMAKAKVRRAAANAKRVKKRTFGHPTTITGKKKAIMILANYDDVEFQTGHDNALYQKIANQENYTEGKFVGSMADYFKAQSRGKFELDFDVVGPVTVSQKAEYYGKNYYINGDPYDEHPGELIIEVVNKAKEQITDWTPYDWDGDGYVDQVYVVYAGKGEADGGAANTIWPHAYDLYSAQGDGDGTGPVEVGTSLYVNSYACGGELNGQTGDIAGIGTMCHEYSHCLGYPDFYDTDYSGGQGMSDLDLMDSGSYNGDGYQPAGYTCYERWFAGWETPITLEDDDVAVESMKSLQSGGESYIMYNKGNRDEYFLLENRQLDGWDASLSAPGLLIIHVDYDVTTWEDNEPNDDPDHQRLTWIPPGKTYQYVVQNGTKYFYTTEQDLFPYGSVTAFNKKFGTLAKLYNKNSDNTYYLSSSVEDITQNADGTISFNFVAEGGGSGDNTLFYESFDDCAGTGGNDGYWNGSIAAGAMKSSSSESDTDNVGWSTTNAYKGDQCAKFGTGSANGSATSPSFTVNGTATLTFKAGAWDASKDGTTLNLSVSSGTISPKSVMMTKGAWGSYTATIAATGNTKITFAAQKGRFFLDEVLAVDPTATGIKGISITERPADNRIYSIDGRYVGNDLNILRPGIYIVGGRKVVR